MSAGMSNFPSWVPAAKSLMTYSFSFDQSHSTRPSPKMMRPSSLRKRKQQIEFTIHSVFLRDRFLAQGAVHRRQNSDRPVRHRPEAFHAGRLAALSEVRRSIALLDHQLRKEWFRERGPLMRRLKAVVSTVMRIHCKMHRRSARRATR